MVKVKVVRPAWRPTERNFEVLAARLALGSRKNAADHLGIHLSTVEKHLTLILVGTPAVDDAQAGLIWHDELVPYLADYE